MIGDRDRPSVDEEIQIPTGLSQDPFASAVRATRMPMVITDPCQDDNPIVFCNDAFTRLTGYGREEILGRNCRFLQGPATRESDIAAIRAAVAGESSVEIDILNYRKDGTTFWNALLISPVFVEGKLAYFFASQMDVTDRKRAEEHSFLLNRELDHRVKNTLATVQTLVLQTLKDASVPTTVASAVAGRLQALARSHDVLTREAWASALMADVIEGALEPTRAEAGDRIHVDGPDIRLRPRIATMLSLAIHELGDNAMRHGALSSPKGTVDVRWSVADGRLRFTWREAGGPAVSPPTRPGYGIRIVERVLAAEFGGRAEIDFAGEGVVFRLDAPAEGLAVERTAWVAP
ncbi:hypothetical protein ASG43_16925 [Aureimonas sp. Leaf454]|uniref:HWE histidine kinase domain-containing protein n=1 Tax=Aureimonas sp. Leaf454 TaxID=1736381 RepID=UPI0006F39C65|nr:HWE histidine kinase domain-containing protein [Aureimonas sp. Leaf454]KQT41969.1 hypothetical protein ASG43_16925 [Aureimonas sp. Leaf454]